MQSEMTDKVTFATRISEVEVNPSEKRYWAKIGQDANGIGDCSCGHNGFFTVSGVSPDEIKNWGVNSDRVPDSCITLHVSEHWANVPWADPYCFLTPETAKALAEVLLAAATIAEGKA